jgi:hypothetical protein
MAAGYVAEAAWLTQQDAILHARLEWVNAQLIAGRPMPPAASGPGRPTGQARPVGTQNLLLGSGALLLVLAAVVFVAVQWDRLGAAGQETSLAGLVAVLSAAAHGLRRRFRSTAESLAATAAATATVAVLAAPSLGLGAAWMTDHPARWAATALASVAVLSGLGALVSRLATWHVALVVSSGASALAAAFGWLRFGAPDPLVIGLIAGFATAALVAPVPSAVPAAFHRDLHALGWTLGGIAVPLTTIGYADLTHHLAWSCTWLVVAAGCAIGLRFPRSPAAGTPALLAMAGAFAAGQVLPLVAVDPARTATPVVCALLAVGAVPLVLSVRRGLALVGIVAATTHWLVTLSLAEATGPTPGRLLAGYLTIPAAALFTVAVLPALAGSTVARSWLVPRASRWPMAWVAAVVGSVAVWSAVDHSWSDRLGELSLESRTLPAAALLLVAGLTVRWLRGRGGSVMVAGPALVTALGPATVAAVVESGLGDPATRSAVMIAIGVLLAAAGAGARLRAPVLLGAATAVITAVAQLSTVIDLVPRWVSLGTGGALLLAAGFGYEALFRLGRHAVTAVHTLR